MRTIFLIGLGYVPYALGIKLDDGYAGAQARLVNPDMIWMSKEYYQIIWKIYFQHWRDHPAELLRIYGEKIILSLKLLDYPILYALSSAAFLFYMVRYWRSTGFPDARSPATQYSLVAILALAMGGLFFLQGIVFMPDNDYSFPSLVFPSLILLAALGLRRECRN
ncbi:MAG: hypothetical protein ORO03_01420 [Alphaproteobacteria bacterium]|nr:hypothetical protein [Alphaproteobacteria bacterium]